MVRNECLAHISTVLKAITDNSPLCGGALSNNYPLPEESEELSQIRHIIQDQNVDPQQQTVSFRMNRSITTVRDAWNEYFYGGLDANNIVRPSIKSLESAGNSWRGPLSSTEGKFYARRKALFKVLERIIITEGESELTVLSLLEDIMNNNCKTSLRKLSEHLSSAMTAWNNNGSLFRFLNDYNYGG